MSKPDDQNWPAAWPRVSPRKWWRDYDSECLEWWRVYVRRESTTAAAQVAILVARFGNARNLGQPLCAITPSAYVCIDKGPIDLGAFLEIVGLDA